MKISVTESQLEKIKYECMLLRKTPEQLYTLAPQMFITEKNNTPAEKEIPPINPEPNENNKKLTEMEDKDPARYGDGYDDELETI